MEHITNETIARAQVAAFGQAREAISEGIASAASTDGANMLQLVQALKIITEEERNLVYKNPALFQD